VIDVERVDFVSIPSRDRDRSAMFYGETLGITRNPLSHENFPEFETGNVTLAIVVPEAMGMEFQPLPPGQIALRVPDVPEARAKLEEAGIVFEGETFDSGVCHMAFFRDPDGNGLLIHHRYAPYPDGSTP
jgi:catechol 2,3-dioxygenase-like lactoylglutathione lyase family enzyme